MTARPTTPNRIPAGATVVGQRSALCIEIIRKAIAQRRHLLRFGGGSLLAKDVERPIRALEQWLSENPHPSHATLTAFSNGQLGRDLHYVMPSTAGGIKLLMQFENLIHGRDDH